ncbi:MAG: hypothetical protein OEY14_17725, partial [Myxococcales bacterium]|nr:hypothetical protein [Myxococcales bacterium]
LAHCLGRLGRLNEAEAMARRAIAGKPRSEAHRAMLAWILEGAPPRGIAVEPRDREPTEPSADPPARRPTRQRVREAFEAGMREAGYSALELERAKALWTDFSHDREILALKPETYAAAVQYAIAIVLRRSGETQAVVARRYGVATTSVCSRFGEIREALSLRPGDPRYAAK